ncbi:LOW QUALITY PROTEIN: nucleoporin NUP188 homolog [Pomacea canaliculata]|uniref:LOW QUALITY PROTEIN: nucleoporin NUP188 homolog n=1 Tax=Pomacea canaliculata TaxID=400727 RepID=UPI000D73FF37|nr:LOW QUALITY PROTEIN: nucleoporin NUP188 homolog [Pomacea canaliculata]
MAGVKPTVDSSSNRILWQFITGAGLLRPKELIYQELNKNKGRLVNGLLYYKPASGNPGDALKKERNLSGLQLEFTLKLSQFLGLDEVLSHDLFCAFLINDYRGSKKTLKHVLSHERHSQALILKIRDFFFTERLYLLRCLHYICVYVETDHPYKDAYADFLSSVQSDTEKLQNKILKQLDAICNQQPPSVEKNGVMMTEVSVLAWIMQNLKEQCELLELLFLLNKVYEMEAKTLCTFLELFKKQGFGMRQTYKHLVDESTVKYLKRISYLEMLVVLEAMDVENAMFCWTNNNYDDHVILRSSKDFQDVNNEVSKLGSDPVHSPILLGWTMVRHLYTDRDPEKKDAAEIHKMGNVALKLGVFRVLLDVLNTESFSNDTYLAALVQCQVYRLLNAVLSVFHEDTLGNSVLLYEVCSKLLRQPSVAEEVWQKDSALWLLYESTISYFPFEFTRFIKMSVDLASASSFSAGKVRDLLQDLSMYTEYLDNIQEKDLTVTHEPNVFMLNVDRKPYAAGDLTIYRGQRGQVLDQSAVSQRLAASLTGPLIRWETNYNGWMLLICEVQELLRQITLGAGMVEPAQVERVTLIMELIQEVVKVDADTAEDFTIFLSLCFQVVHRFSMLKPTPLDLLGKTMGCLMSAARYKPKEVWHQMKQTGLLPYLTENVDDIGEVLTGRGLHPGILGSIMAGTECPQGRYPLTLTVLTLALELVQSFSKEGLEEELQPCVLYILRDIFPQFRKWRYSDLVQRKKIGQQCLTLFNKILNLSAQQNKTKKVKTMASRPTLHEVCVYSLLFTEAGKALMEIVATGVDNVEAALVQQGSVTEGSGIDLIELIQLSLSLLNQLLLLRPPDLPLSPVEQALFWQPAGRQSQHVVATVAQYIYHRHNPKLPIMATRLLRHLAVMSPMSILACLGNDAEPIRDMYLTRLQAVSEDLRLKVAILELLSVCVETQPGLIEIFFDVQGQSTDSGEGKKDLKLGRSSCLQTLLTLMEVNKQNTYMCHPELLCACLDLVHSLWHGRRETAMEVLRAKQSFWASVTAPLKREVTEVHEESDFPLRLTEMRIAAFAFRILAQEIYTVTGTSLDTQLKSCLKDLGKDDWFIYWSKFIKQSLMAEQSQEKPIHGMLENPVILLLKAWRSFLIVTSKFKLLDELQVTDIKKEHIIHHLLEGLLAQFSGELSSLNMKIATILAALYFMLLRSWIGSISKPVAILVSLRGAAELTNSVSETLIPSVQIGLIGALNLLLQRARGELSSSAKIPPPTVATLLPVVCPMLPHSTRQLPSPAELAKTRHDEETTGKGRSDNLAESKLMLQVTLCSLLTEIIEATDPQLWLPSLQKHCVLAALLVSLEDYMKAKQSMPYIHSGLLLLTAIAEKEKGAAVLTMSDFTAHTCLAVGSLYSKEEMFATHVLSSKASAGTSGSSISWYGLYCMSVNLYTLLLHKLGFSFLDDALNFLGAHQDRMQQSLDLAQQTLLEPAMIEAECTCLFLHQMALYRRQWRLHLPQVMAKLLMSLLNMLQTFISLLIRPRYLQHLLEHGKDGDKGRYPLQSSPLLHHQTSTEDIEQPSAQLLQTENSMMKILGKSFAVLRHFTPDLCLALLDQSMDMCEFEPLVDLGFSTPSVDHQSPLTFGSLISCVSACLRQLSKVDAKLHSPHKVLSPHRRLSRTVSVSETQTQTSRSLLLFIMENCLTLTLSQACRNLREPALPQREKQFLKRELSTELNSFLVSLARHLRRGTPGSPGDKSVFNSPHAGSVSTLNTSSATNVSAQQSLSRSQSQTCFSSSNDQQFFRLVQEFVKKVLR